MDYYSSIAAGYNNLHGEEQDKKLQRFLERVNLKENLTLLDVGCGTGRSFTQLELYNVQWHGIDPSKGLREQASKQIQARIILAAAEQIPWPEASFDVILSLTALQNFADPHKGLKEMRRVAKPGALVMISFLRKSDKKNMLDTLIRSTFTVEESWEEAQDCMYLCKVAT